MNQELIRARSQIVKLVRRYFDEQGFLELHTPRLVGLPGQEPFLDPFWTELKTENRKLKTALVTSPEYAMKRMLAEGLDKIYDLGPCFRNGEPWDGSHDPEFLMLEWYRRDAGLEELMEDTEKMMKFVASNFEYRITSNDSKLATRYSLLEKPFRRLTVRDAMKQYAHTDLDALLGDREAMAAACREHGQTVSETDTWDDLFFKLFLSEVEPKVASEPTFLYEYPASMAALARKHPQHPQYALRVEAYAGGLELANGFAELADASEQRKRFEEEQALRKTLGKETWPLDERLLTALPKMGDAAGIAFGVDRLAMLLTGTKSISDLMPIPVSERF